MGQRAGPVGPVHAGRLRRQAARERPHLSLEGALLGQAGPPERVQPGSAVRHGAAQSRRVERAVDWRGQSASHRIPACGKSRSSAGLHLRAGLLRAAN
ncbi:MAG: hypothetical protein DMG27_17485 [Acidobacteria bacterium]|nr:MAG: hypothetical protein DMG27_17485 [Acidobacteriota bacterium]